MLYIYLFYVYIFKLKIHKMSSLEINYENFEWKKYLKINKDLLIDGILNKELAWNHWINFGNKECRPVSLTNNSCIHNGRFGNLFFINMAVHFICLKNKLKFNYKYYDEFKSLGIDLFIGNQTFSESITLTDDNFLHIIINNNEYKNIIINNEVWCQSSNFCIFLKEYFSLEKIKGKIMKKNKFKERYDNNNDLFLHVRLGDIENTKSSHYNYYNTVLKNISFNKGYISSDTIESKLCKKIIKKYNLKIIDYNEVETIMFASTCSNIVLSGGTFSWLIGFLAYYSKKIYYPKDKKNKWYGDIFIFSDWIGISE